MKRLMFASVCLLSTSVFSAVPIDGWYAEIFGGYTYMPGNVDTTLNGLYWSDVKYQSGYNAGGRFGFKDNPMRYEGEVGYISASANQFNVNGISQTGISGQTTATTAMVNAYYDFPEIIETLSPFLGAGIGYAYVSSHLFGGGPSMLTEFRGTNSAFAYQGTAGIAYNFVDNYSLSIAYRYFSTNRISQLGNTFQVHMASAGVTYRFDGNLYK